MNPQTPRRPAVLAAGAIAGLTWAAALRAYMAELAGSGSTIRWWPTFGGILLPGGVAGSLLAWSWIAPPRRRWLLGIAPIAFAIAPLLEPGALVALATTGLGGGAVAIALMAIGGSYSLGGLGPRWSRWLTGGVVAVLTVALGLSGPFVGGSRLALTSARGAWVALLACGLVVSLILAGSAAFRAENDPADSAHPATSPPVGYPSTGSGDTKA